MGRRGNVRGRPGFLFMTVFAICLIIFYLSWRSLMSPDTKVHNISLHRQSLFDESGKLKRKDESAEKFIGGKLSQDPDYNIFSAIHKKKGNVPVLQQNESANDKDKTASKVIAIKPLTQVARPSDVNRFYSQPNNLITETVASMERFVHLDLKGAAPKMTYLRSFIPLIKKLGATGLLIEYEDMFPYTGLLEHIRAKNAYSMDDIKEILKLAETFQLKVMPLIQTFGHMEYVLKSEFRQLRENDYTPQVIDITQNASYTLIYEMIKQMLNAHPHVTHLHIGCGEVYELGKGASAVAMQTKKLSESQIFLQHVERVASLVRGQADTNVIPVIWDDELRKMQSGDIEKSRLPSLVEIMVWQFTTNVLQYIKNDVLDMYAKVFKSVWIASSFKGSTGARQIFTEPKHHVMNHLSWLNVIAANNHLKFKGIALTGWQRYDHFATLCELLPVAIPSLGMCLATMINAGFTKEIHMAVSKLINCGSIIEMTFPKHGMKTRKASISHDCRFPGRELYYAVHELYGYRVSSSASIHRLDGWLSDYQVTHSYSSPGQLRALARSLTKESSEYAMLSVPLKRHLAVIYFEDTVDEWMDENVQERLRHIGELQKKIQLLQHRKTWPLRPLLPAVDITESNQFANPYKDNHGNNFENSTHIQLVSQTMQDKVQNENAEVLTTRSSQNLPDNKFTYLNKQNQLDSKQATTESDQKLILGNSKTPNGITLYEKIYDRKVAEERFTEEKNEFPQLKSSESNKREGSINRKVSNDYKASLLYQKKLEDTNKEGKNMTSEDINHADLHEINVVRDEKRESSYAIPHVSESTYLQDVQAQKFPDLKINSDSIQVDDDNKMKREKYIMDVKNARFQDEQGKSNSLRKAKLITVKRSIKSTANISTGIAKSVHINDDNSQLIKKKSSEFVLDRPSMTHVNDSPESHAKRFEVVRDGSEKQKMGEKN